MQQRSEQWHLIRKAKFTASDIVNICGDGKTFETAVYSKAYEAILPESQYLEMCLNARSSAAMQWGNDWEDTARQEYEQRTGAEVTQVGFIEYTKDSGGSPDGIIESLNGQIEIKCPYEGTNHIKFFRIKKAEELLDLTKDSKKYYYQMQANILFNKSEWCDFISFDPRCNDILRMRIVRCYPNDKILKIIDESIPKATEFKRQIIDDIISNSSNVITEEKELRI
ncbi:YqaJ viral recombinase family protein [Dysgonomonas sp. Marseille-P4677]|uniref:lambda exonuclease family protein n=1 Tax=Dysgonomonas sp. Marseille-P4677 TaxID=2364790 RepID=UPI001911E197|nr:lambda exonuclease family protein [Dysgonomonas sp. Marseille-P4677]MBK5722917.1 YqaJ viral recombinase family protein [Dysgonomonas sp. Marseille-P4677]